MDLLKLMSLKSFDDSIWQDLGVNPGNITLPCFLGASQIFIIHGRGAYEAFRDMKSEHKHLRLVDHNYYPWASHEASGKILQFLDRHLRGAEYVNLERVGIQMRLGNREWYWRTEADWPVPATQYTRWHLRGDGSLSTSPESGPKQRLEYSSKAPVGGKKSGVSFQSSPFEKDMEFAGHFTVTLSVSSSMSDADVIVTLWPVDEQGKVVPFGAKGEPEPFAKGFLRASHRKTDPPKSLPERPWHTHAPDDYAPLAVDEVVSIEVEIFPAAGRIRKGWLLRLDISPSEDLPDIPGYDPLPMRAFYGEDKEEGTKCCPCGWQSGGLHHVPCCTIQARLPQRAVSM